MLLGVALERLTLIKSPSLNTERMLSSSSTVLRLCNLQELRMTQKRIYKPIC